MRRGEDVGARRGDEELGAWLAELGRGRVRAALLSDDPADDVADPIGGPAAAYEATASALEELVERLVAVAFPVRTAAPGT